MQNRHAELLKEWQGLKTGYWLTDLANASAHLFNGLPDLNWVGFYLLVDGKLKLGPFQGQVACVEIPVGKGVCGSAVSQRISIRVEDVHQFPGHIACDSRSASELVVPFGAPKVWGVLDLDSPTKGRFSKEDQIFAEAFCASLIDGWTVPPWGH